MPVICIGPVCVPLNLFLPFVLGILHQAGYLQWIKREWVTWVYWRPRLRSWLGYPPEPATQPATGTPAAGAAPAAAGGGGTVDCGMEMDCSGGVCRVRPRPAPCRDEPQPGSGPPGEGKAR